MTKKYLLVEVGGVGCEMLYEDINNRDDITTIYCLKDAIWRPDCKNCPHGHTEKEIIDRRTVGIYHALPLGIWAQLPAGTSWDVAKKLAAATLDADLEAK
jgi:hypothetical protein